MPEVLEGTNALEDLKDWYANLDEHEDGGVFMGEPDNRNFEVSEKTFEGAGKGAVEEYLDTRNGEGDFYAEAEESTEVLEFAGDGENQQLEQSNAGRLLKPGGHFHKPLIGIGIFLVLALAFIFFGPSGSSSEEKIKVTSKAGKLPESKSSEELTGVTPGNSDGSFGENSNSNSQSSILGDTNTATNSNPLLSNSNSNSAIPPQPVTTVKESTTVQQVDANGQPIQSNVGQSAPQPAPRVSNSGNRRERQRENISDGFTVELGEENIVRSNGGYQNQSPRNPESDTPITQLKVLPGSKIEMSLDEPFRSGIESKVQATSLNNIKGTDGRIIVPANSKFELSFRPEEIQGRVLARPVIRIFLPNGSIGEMIGMVKGKDGYAGIGGKVTKQDGKGLSGSIIGGIARVGSRMLGGAGVIGSEVGNEIQNSEISSQDTQIYRSNRVVEVGGGTRFVIFIGTPE